MYIDAHNRVSAAQAVTAAAASTDYIDLGAARDVGMAGKQQHLAITCDESATAAGAATVAFQLQCDDNNAFSSPKTVIQTDAIGKASLTAGMAPIYLPIPPGLNERYVRLYYNVATGPLTAGKFTAQVVEGIQANKAYPDAI